MYLNSSVVLSLALFEIVTQLLFGGQKVNEASVTRLFLLSVLCGAQWISLLICTANTQCQYFLIAEIAFFSSSYPL